MAVEVLEALASVGPAGADDTAARYGGQDLHLVEDAAIMKRPHAAEMEDHPPVRRRRTGPVAGKAYA